MFDLDHFVAECRTALKEHSPQSATKELVARAVAHPGEVERALGTPQEGKLVTLYRAPDLTILNLIWAPGVSIYPKITGCGRSLGCTAAERTTSSTDGLRRA